MTARGGQITLEPGQVAVCVHCHAIAEGGFVDTDERCIECGQGGVIVRDVLDRGRKAIAARWGEDTARTGFTGTPNVLLEHLVTLGLSPLDVVLLDLIELHRRESEQAWPSEARLAELSGKSVDTVGRRLRRLRERGLIEWTHERGVDGRWAHCTYTRKGLTAVCALLAANRRAEHDETAGLDDLLAELDHTAVVQGGEPSNASPHCTDAASHTAPVQPATRHQCSTKQRQVEAEANETESSNEASDALSRADVPQDDLADVFGFPEQEVIEGEAIEVDEPEDAPEVAALRTRWRTWAAWRERERARKARDPLGRTEPEPEPERPASEGGSW